MTLKDYYTRQGWVTVILLAFGLLAAFLSSGTFSLLGWTVGVMIGFVIWPIVFNGGFKSRDNSSV